MAFYINNETLANRFVTEFELVDKWISCNTVMGCGSNTFGQLGLSNNDSQTHYQMVPKINNVQQVAAGLNHTLVLKATGGLFGYGDNSNGQLGAGSPAAQFVTPQAAGIGFNISKIVCGNTSSFAVTTDNKLLACGSNTFGQLGIDGDNITSFTLVDGLQDVHQVACGFAHTIVLKRDGTLAASGANSFGQCGGVTSTRFTAIADISNIKNIACGKHHSIALSYDGTIYVTGLNAYHQLGVNINQLPSFTQVPDITDIKYVATCETHTVLIKNDGSLLVCGLNYDGELGMGDAASAYTVFTPLPTSANVKYVYCVPKSTTLVKTDGTMWFTGVNSGQQPLFLGTYKTFQVIPGIADIKQAAIGKSHTVLLQY